MPKNVTTNPEARGDQRVKWIFLDFKEEAAQVASLAKKQSKSVYYGQYGKGASVSFFLPRAARSYIKRTGRDLRLGRKRTLRLFATEVELALKESYGHKAPQVICTKRRIQIKL